MRKGKKHVVTKSIPVFRYSTVFNISQVDNPPEEAMPPAMVDPVNRIEKVEQFVSATKADIRYGGNRAFFSPGSRPEVGPSLRKRPRLNCGG